MARFAVWAPRPDSVELQLADRRHPMARSDDGWWRVEVPDVPTGTRYGFCLDGERPLPDPRSPRQPDGTDHLSATFDTSAFEWTDAGWGGFELDGAVLYELHVGTFTPAGTLDAAIERLPDLADLGIDAVEVMPVAAAPGHHGWGYDGVDLFAVHEDYGGPAALQRFVDAAHRLGLGVLLDVVYNHLGPSGNHLPAFAPYFTDRHSTPWGDGLDFDGPAATEVRRFVLDNARRWLRDFHLDGLRLDAVHEIHDDSPTSILAELAVEVATLAVELGRPLSVVAESDRNDPVLLTPRPAGEGMTAAWADDWHHALHTVLTGEGDGYYEDYGELDDLVKALEQAWVYDGRWSEHLQRHRGGPPTGIPAHRFVICAQNHDQIGNRARGERLVHLVSRRRAQVAAALLLTSPFTPLLFQGEEWGASAPFLYFTDHDDPDLARDVREGRRAEFAAFGWAPDDVPDPQAATTFERSKLDWTERSDPQHAAMLDWYRALLALRRAEPALQDPGIPAIAAIADGFVTVARGDILVVADLTDERRSLPLPTEQPCLLATDGVAITTKEPRRG